MPVTVIVTAHNRTEWVPGDHSWTMCAELRGEPPFRHRHAAQVGEFRIWDTARLNG